MPCASAVGLFSFVYQPGPEPPQPAAAEEALSPELAGQVLGQLFHHAGGVGQGQSGGGQGLGIQLTAAGGTQGVIPGPTVCGVGVIGSLQLLGADNGQSVAYHIPGEHVQGHIGEQVAAGEHLLPPGAVVLGPAEGLLRAVELLCPLGQRGVRMLIQPRLKGVDGAEGA